VKRLTFSHSGGGPSAATWWGEARLIPNGKESEETILPADKLLSQGGRSTPRERGDGKIRRGNPSRLLQETTPHGKYVVVPGKKKKELRRRDRSRQKKKIHDLGGQKGEDSGEGGEENWTSCSRKGERGFFTSGAD